MRKTPMIAIIFIHILSTAVSGYPVNQPWLYSVGNQRVIYSIFCKHYAKYCYYLSFVSEERCFDKW